MEVFLEFLSIVMEVILLNSIKVDQIKKKQKTSTHVLVIGYFCVLYSSFLPQTKFKCQGMCLFRFYDYIKISDETSKSIRC